ncbi:MAG: PPC domain-containing protein [Gemmataceae bacterium]
MHLTKSLLCVVVLTIGSGFLIPKVRAEVNRNGSLENTDKFCPHRAGRREDVYRIHLKAGVRYTINLESRYDNYLYLENSQGRLLTSNDDGGNGANARIVYTPATSGIYQIVATSYSAGQTGPYTLKITP